VAHDVTAHDALREQLHRRERLVTAGTLTSGIGHEVNNPLAYVMANLEFALEEVHALAGPRPSAQLTELLEVLAASRQGAERIKKIVRGLRAFARAESEPGAVALPELLEVAANLAQHALMLRATLRLELSPTPEVFAEEPRLTQVFVTLLVHAAHRFPTEAPSTNSVWVRSGLTPTGSVFVEVLDNGPALAPEALAHLFEASLETPRGHGDGLGLAVCHAVVVAFGGTLTCRSEGAQTCFRLTLQRANTTAATPPRALPRSRVLVVDDEPAILAVLGRLLRDEHEVVVEADAERALTLLLDDQQHFDVVFCDLVMPRRTGVQLYWEVHRKDPALAERFVLMTGGVVNDGIRDFLAAVKNPRLEKPFEASAVRELAARKAHTPPHR
jgi:CheY-like chemotaxis protein